MVLFKKNYQSDTNIVIPITKKNSGLLAQFQHFFGNIH